MNKQYPYNIIEVANTHGGDFKYLKKLIKTFKAHTENFGIKFQPLRSDLIAKKSYQWFPTYEKLFFSEDKWQEIIEYASETKDVWLDLFDLYGVEILKKNLYLIYGIKFQASVLYNYELLEALKDFDLSNKKIIINISSFEIVEIEKILKKFEKDYDPVEVWLEIGYQSYPTKLEDSGLSKIAVIKEKFQNKIVFADHVDATHEDAIWLPCIAILNGASIIEKHVRLDQKTEYDFYSSLLPSQYNQMLEIQKKYCTLLKKPFLVDAEIEYVENSLMKPFLSASKLEGSLINFKKDLIFRRSNEQVLSLPMLEDIQKKYYCLDSDLSVNCGFQKENFRKANIANIVACRLKSSRLKSKALLKIGELTSVEFCLRNALRFENVDQTVLATSTNSEDDKLIDYTYNEKVNFFQGEEDDVIQRYIDACEQFGIDVIIRITADMPFIDNEICQILLQSHFETGADYTTASDAAVGTNLEVINLTALNKVKHYFPVAKYSEYMSWYFQNNPDFFNLNFVNLPEKNIRNYRLTLDYKEDLEMFNIIEDEVGTNANLSDVFSFLDLNKEIASINSHLTLKYKTDSELIELLNKATKIYG